MRTNGNEALISADLPAYIPQLVTLDELAERWHLPISWLRENCRSRCDDPLPVFRLGRYVRVDLNDPKLADWLRQRRGR